MNKKTQEEIERQIVEIEKVSSGHVDLCQVNKMITVLGGNKTYNKTSKATDICYYILLLSIRQMHK